MKPKLYLIITNISKSNNIKSLLLAAAAYGADTVFVAGQRKFRFQVENDDDDDDDDTEGGSSSNNNNTDVPRPLHPLLRNGSLQIVRFDCLEDCITHIRSTSLANKTNKPIRIMGVEIVEDAQDLDTEPFSGDTAIMMGNEGSGMNQKQMDACDGFIRIAQYGGGTASLNVNVAANLVMHRFHIWSRSRSLC